MEILNVEKRFRASKERKDKSNLRPIIIRLNILKLHLSVCLSHCLSVHECMHLLFTCACVCKCLLTSKCVGVMVKGQLAGIGSSSTMWVPDIKFMSSGSVKRAYPLSHLASSKLPVHKSQMGSNS